jgi:hypothetical protein
MYWAAAPKKIETRSLPQRRKLLPTELTFKVASRDLEMESSGTRPSSGPSQNYSGVGRSYPRRANRGNPKRIRESRRNRHSPRKYRVPLEVFRPSSFGSLLLSPVGASGPLQWTTVWLQWSTSIFRMAWTLGKRAD